MLIPPGSWLEDHEETLPHRGELDEASFTYRWKHPDPRMDRLQKEVAKLVEQDAESGEDPAATFYSVMELARGQPEGVTYALPAERQRVPRMSESWFC